MSQPTTPPRRASPAANPQPLDLIQLSPGYRVEVRTAESEAERDSRLRREEAAATHALAEEQAKANHERTKELDEAKQRRLVFWAVFGLLLVIVGVSVWIVLFDDDASSETQTFARTAITAILAGLVGYFGGSMGKAPPPPPLS